MLNLHVPAWFGTIARHEKNALTVAILDKDWERTQIECIEHPAMARAWCHDSVDGTHESRALPIHLAVASKEPSLESIGALVQAYPDSLVCKESSGLRTPLHLACLSQNSDSEIVQFLLQYNPDAALIVDRIERLPIHYACANNRVVSGIDALLDRFPETSQRRDGQGWLPLHIACHYGAPLHTIQRLVAMHPEAVVALTPLDRQTPRALLRLNDDMDSKEKEGILKLVTVGGILPEV